MKVGDDIEAGATIGTIGTIGTIEAMKMEAAITTPTGGTITSIAITTTVQVDADDLIIDCSDVSKAPTDSEGTSQ